MKIYSYDQQLLDMGASPCVIAKNLMIYRPGVNGGNDLSEIDLDVLAATVRSMPPGQTVLLDIEAYDPKTEPDRAAQNIAFAARVWKQLDPTATVGVYRIVPEIRYDAPTKIVKLLIDRQCDAISLEEKHRDVDTWQQQNDRMAEAIVPCVDYLCPCLYAVRDWPYWKAYAHAQLIEARRLARGKPVWPIVWATFRDRSAIPAAQWETMCRWLGTHFCVNDVVVYSTPSLPTADNWREVLVASISEPELVVPDSIIAPEETPQPAAQAEE